MEHDMKPGYYWLRVPGGWGHFTDDKPTIVHVHCDGGIEWMGGEGFVYVKDAPADAEWRGPLVSPWGESASACLNPAWDATDQACPAWWRGQERGVDAAAERVVETLEGQHCIDGMPTFGSPKLTEAVRRVAAIVALFEDCLESPDDAERGVAWAEVQSQAEAGGESEKIAMLAARIFVTAVGSQRP